MTGVVDIVNSLGKPSMVTGFLSRILGENCNRTSLHTPANDYVIVHVQF